MLIILRIASVLNLSFSKENVKTGDKVSSVNITLGHGQQFVHQLQVQQACTRKWEVQPQAGNVKE
jgi:hypothetical protein